VHPSAQILQKAVASWETTNSQRYLQIASGSASELDYHFLLARDLGFFEELDYRRLAGELLQLRKMLTSLLQKVQSERLTG
jgi:four helix bundle protein